MTAGGMGAGREVLRPAALRPPLGPYSHGIRVAPGAEWLAVAGQVAVGPDGEVVGRGDLAAQARQVFENLRAVLDEAGYGFEDVVRMTTYLVRREDVVAYRDIRSPLYETHFPPEAYPTSTLLVVQGLAHPDYLIEIDALAARAAGG